MMVIQLREDAQEKAFELIDELHDLGHLKKMALCELEDTLYDCFESEDGKEVDDKSDEGTDLGFKSKYNRHYAMRNFDDTDDEQEMHNMRSRRRSMRMRRNRMGRFA